MRDIGMDLSAEIRRMKIGKWIGITGFIIFSVLAGLRRRGLDADLMGSFSLLCLVWYFRMARLIKKKRNAAQVQADIPPAP